MHGRLFALHARRPATFSNGMAYLGGPRQRMELKSNCPRPPVQDGLDQTSRTCLSAAQGTLQAAPSLSTLAVLGLQRVMMPMWT